MEGDFLPKIEGIYAITMWRGPDYHLLSVIM